MVLCELAWTLGGRIYRFDRHAIAAAIENLLETAIFEFQSRDLIRLALVDYRQGRAGFADYLIGQQNAFAGCAETVTFDTSLALASGFSQLE
jgi:predicted nucleic-acid-binding protein